MSETKTVPAVPLSADDVIWRLCVLQAEVFNHLPDSDSADCFCGKSGFWGTEGYGGTFDKGYRNSGKCLEFIENAVREKLAAAPNTTPDELVRLKAFRNEVMENMKRFAEYTALNTFAVGVKYVGDVTLEIHAKHFPKEQSGNE